MRRNLTTISSWLFASMLLLKLASCKSEPSPLAEGVDQGLAGDSLKTLQSLQKVSDYPLFVMTYYGDYGFRHALKAGVPPTSQEINDELSMKEVNWRCTCFAGFGDGSNPVFGRNFDWSNRACLLLFTDPPNGFASVSMVDIYYCCHESNPDLTSLESRRGLLVAPFFPFDGMNEKGVAIGIMAVPYAEPPYDPSKKTLADLAIVRLVLDYAENTGHAVTLMQRYNIRMSEVALHYFIADRFGESAVIEFIDNQMKVLYNPGLFQVSTNFILHDYSPNLLGHCWRYDRVHQSLSTKGGSISMSDGREILSSVSQVQTMWSAVYGLKSGEVQIVPGRRFESPYSTTLQMSD